MFLATFFRRAAFALLASLTIAGCAASDAQSAVPLATAAPDEPPPADEPGTLDIVSTPEAKVLIDGKPAGTTPIKGLKVPAGRHDVTFVDETGNRTMTVSLEPGEGKMVKSDRPPTMLEKKR